MHPGCLPTQHDVALICCFKDRTIAPKHCFVAMVRYPYDQGGQYGEQINNVENHASSVHINIFTRELFMSIS